MVKLRIHPRMPHVHTVVSVDRTARGIIVTFADGRSALFPGELLYAMLSQAEDLSGEPLESATEPDAA